MRPLIYEFQTDERVIEESFDFMLGRSILVANVLEKAARTRKVYLPKECDWFDWYSRKMYTGGQSIEVQVSLASIPMFFRSGAIIPMTENLMNIHKDSIEKLNLLIDHQSNLVLFYMKMMA